jgi:UPF0755 protein
LLRKLLLLAALVLIGAGFAFTGWATRPILALDKAAIEFTIPAGSGVKQASRQITQAGAPVSPLLLEILTRLSGNATKLKAGVYQLQPGTSPWGLVCKMVRGEFVMDSLTIIEGWTFKQMRELINRHPGLRHEARDWSEKELLAKVAPDYKVAEGLFYPETYTFARGSSDIQIYRQAHALMMRQLNAAWEKRDPSLPYKTPYEALTMASIVEKETGQRAERTMIAGVFVNRLRRGMLLQTDPTVIYGMGERFDGNIRKRDLVTDTPYNTYTRAGLPPSPIALPGGESIHAALNPADTDALYFVARGDGTSYFSKTLREHEAAVDKYQRRRPAVLK